MTRQLASGFQTGWPHWLSLQRKGVEIGCWKLWSTLTDGCLEKRHARGDKREEKVSKATPIKQRRETNRSRTMATGRKWGFLVMENLGKSGAKRQSPRWRRWGYIRRKNRTARVSTRNTTKSVTSTILIKPKKQRRLRLHLYQKVTNGYKNTRTHFISYVKKVCLAVKITEFCWKGFI